MIFSLLWYSYAAQQKVHLLKMTPDGVTKHDEMRVASSTFTDPE
jgi:hypothetical protein